jgi:hypothetical protein
VPIITALPSEREGGRESFASSGAAQRSAAQRSAAQRSGRSDAVLEAAAAERTTTPGNHAIGGLVAGKYGTTLGNKGVMGEFEYISEPYDGARIAATAAKKAAREARKDAEPYPPPPHTHTHARALPAPRSLAITYTHTHTQPRPHARMHACTSHACMHVRE